ncbi:SipW-dependent-type signal peptide-containing protein [Halolamina sp. CBA1230]|uniref:SipW-dependent-type signal peptide-containing protein n=1 Tax=Halolamina sp. CBA1230 TaxID=1853690 RepID=UPI0009A23205|nr:SipW-dependent-type signal peptide-containing protein [Halolamina sp. CBA1230]
MSDRSTSFELSRRKVLAGLGSVGLASAGAGLGTSAYLNDTESFEGNTISAGELDLKVDWEEHYSYPQLYGFDDPENGLDYGVHRSEPDEPDNYVGMPDPSNPQVWVHEDDLGTYMMNTSIEAFPDPNHDGVQEVEDGEFTYMPCDHGADLNDDLDPGEEGTATRTNNDSTVGTEGEPKPLISLEDVKPGDFGELTLSFHLCDNPGYVWLQAMGFSEAENGINDPEGEVDETSEMPELAENIQTVWWYDSRGDNVLQTDCEEKLYLADSGTSPTTLFEVTLDDDSGEAELTELLGPGEYSDNDFDQTDAIATTPNGDKILFYDKNSGHLGTYDIDGDTFTDEGPISSDPGGIVLAGYSPSGTLWAASQDTDELYTVDPSAPSVTSQGDTGIDLSGADLVFSSDGTMYIWTANTDDDGLYQVNDPSNDPTAVPVDEDNIGVKDERITGLAIRDAGTGNLVASDRDNDEIHVVDRTDGSITESYAMTLDNEPYEYDFGDMTAGAYCGEVFRRGTLAGDLDLLESGQGIALDGNRASEFDELAGDPFADSRECFMPGVTHYVGFAWWVPTTVGNEIQGDSLSFDLGFYTEQCRNNDNPGGS